MSAQINVPVFDHHSFIPQADQAADRHETRYLFTPFLEPDLRQDPVDFDTVPRGKFRSVMDYTYTVPNTDQIMRMFNTSVMQEIEATRVPWTRAAAYCAEGIMRAHSRIGDRMPSGTPTGLVQLHSLQGLDPRRPEDLALLFEMNQTFWPVNYEHSVEHRDFVNAVDLSVAMRHGTSILGRFEKLQKELLDAITKSEQYCRYVYNGLADDLRGVAAGGPRAVGMKRQASDADRAACIWLDVPEPARPINQLEGVGTANDLIALATAQMAAQNEQSERMAEMLEIIGQGMANKTDENQNAQMFAALSEMIRSQQETTRMLAERLTPITVTTKAESEAELVDLGAAASEINHPAPMGELGRPEAKSEPKQPKPRNGKS